MTRLVWIFLVLVAALVVDMPATVKLGSLTLYRPRLDFSFAGRRLYRDLEIRLGLDLQGGTHLAYESDTRSIPEGDRDKALEATRVNIEKRVNLLGVAEAIIQTAKVGDSRRLLVELPGVKNIDQAMAVIGQTAQLDFRESKVATPSSQTDFVTTGLTGKDLRLAQVQFDKAQPTVGIEFTPEGGKKFAEITGRNVSKPLAIFLDEQVITAPIVQSAITDNRAVISGNFALAEAKNLVIQLNAGALPVPIKIVEQRSIGATLGEESVKQSLLAGAVGLGVVWLFMIANYGWRGVVADLALVVYILVSLAIIKLIPVTLTLAGIAGFVLSIGMAVDANILIFERIKEELRWGRPHKAALELGFHRAWNSIRDSNISSLLTAGILFWFGSGAVRGFALTLAVGVFVSLFSAITVTRSLLKA